MKKSHLESRKDYVVEKYDNFIKIRVFNMPIQYVQNTNTHQADAYYAGK